MSISKSRDFSPEYRDVGSEHPESRAGTPRQTCEEYSLRPIKSRSNSACSHRRPTSPRQTEENQDDYFGSGKLSLWSDIRLLVLICHCNLAHRVLQDLTSLVPSPTLPITTGGGTPIGGIQLLPITFAAAEILGSWIAVILMLRFGIAPIIQASLFITGILASASSFLYQNYEGTYNQDVYYSMSAGNGRGISMTLVYTICAMTASALTPAALVLVASRYPQQLQPSRLVVWGAMGVFGSAISQLSVIPASQAFNLVIAIQGPYFAAFSLGIHALLETPDLRSTSCSLLEYTKTSIRPQNKHFASVRMVFANYRAQVLASLKDPQVYFFLVTATLDGFDRWVYSQADCAPFVVYSKLATILVYICCGLLLWKIPQLRIALFVTSIAIKTIFGWRTRDAYTGCTVAGFWFMMAAIEAAGFRLVCLASLFTANVAGPVRRAFVVAIICTGYGVGLLLQIPLYVISLNTDADIGRPVISFCSGAMALGVGLYAGWLRYQNKRRKRVVVEMGLSDADSARLERIATESGVTDIENVHFRYQY